MVSVPRLVRKVGHPLFLLRMEISSEENTVPGRKIMSTMEQKRNRILDLLTASSYQALIL